MRAPCHRLLVYFVALKEREEVEQLVERFDLLLPNKNYVERVFEHLEKPRSFVPSRRHKRSLEFIRKLGVEPLASGGPAVEDAFKILSTARDRERVEAWSIAGAPTSFIEEGLRKRGREYAPNAVAVYRRFMFDPELMTRGELRKLCEPLGDARTAAARLPAGPSSMAAVCLALGEYPHGADLHALLADARTVLAVRTLEAAADDRRPPRAAERYAGAFRKVCDAMEHLADPGEQVRKQLQSLQLRMSEEKRTLVSELGGEVSTSIVDDTPLLEQALDVD